MAKAGIYKVTWSRSVSADVVALSVKTTINGTETVADVDPAVEEMTVQVNATSSVVIEFKVTDSEGMEATTTYNFTVGDLENPQPVTGVAHQLLSIIDV